MENDSLLSCRASSTSEISKHLLEKLHLLHSNKGSYINPSFCKKLEATSCEIDKIIAKKSTSRKIFNFYQLQPPEKVSDSMVDLCLKCIELRLQEISYLGCTSISQRPSQAMRILVKIRNDLNSLSTCVRLTLKPSSAASEPLHLISTHKANGKNFI